MVSKRKKEQIYLHEEDDDFDDDSSSESDNCGIEDDQLDEHAVSLNKRNKMTYRKRSKQFDNKPMILNTVNSSKSHSYASDQVDFGEINKYFKLRNLQLELELKEMNQHK